MAKYYNTTSSPVAVTLSDGSPAVIMPRNWVEIDSSKEGSASLSGLLRKGVLVREAIVEPAPSPKPAPIRSRKAVPDAVKPKRRRRKRKTTEGN